MGAALLQKAEPVIKEKPRPPEEFITGENSTRSEEFTVEKAAEPWRETNVI